jgi:hypothetical protein
LENSKKHFCSRLLQANSLQKKAWEISQNPETEEKTKVQALSLAKECMINKLDLLTNATVVDDAIRFVEQSKEKLMSSKKVGNHDKEFKEDDHDHLELELKQSKEESREFTTTTTATINQVF